jgi:hypothetical protein
VEVSPSGAAREFMMQQELIMMQQGGYQEFIKQQGVNDALLIVQPHEEFAARSMDCEECIVPRVYEKPIEDSPTQEGVRELIIRRRRIGDNYYLDYSTGHDCLTKF